jgi:hypothetical protein
VTAAATLTGLLFVAGIFFGAGLIFIDTRTPPSANTNRLTWLVSGFFPAGVSCGCLVVAAATLLAHVGGGLYWFVPSALGAVAFGLINAWVLLVEILR